MRHVQDDARQRQIKDRMGNVRRPQPYVADASVLIPAVAAVPVHQFHGLALDFERELPAAGKLSLHIAPQPGAGHPELLFDGPREDVVLVAGPVHDELLAVQMLSSFPVPAQALRSLPLLVAEVNAPLLGLDENDRNIAAGLLAVDAYDVLGALVTVAVVVRAVAAAHRRRDDNAPVCVVVRDERL